MARKKKKKRKGFLVKPVIMLFSLFFIYLVFIISLGTVMDFQPNEKIDVAADQQAQILTVPDTTLSFIIWNVGFGGLGAESNFFYDDGGFFLSHGKMVRAPRHLVEKNIEGALRLLRSHRADFYLFQEVDLNSARSYNIDQYGLYITQLSGYDAHYAPNMRVNRVPIPILEPWKAYGKVESGLATFSRYRAREATRLQLPGEFSWPTRVFSLDRCILLNRYVLQNGKNLIVMNIHNSAYDQNGALKTPQMNYIKKIALEEYSKGSYIIVGGDWNQCPPYFQFDAFRPGQTQGYTQINIHPEFLPDWQWIYDPTHPTNRKTRNSYEPGQTFVTIIDFYLISPNVKAIEVKTIQQAFQYSDHQPVYLEVNLQ